MIKNAETNAVSKSYFAFKKSNNPKYNLRAALVPPFVSATIRLRSWRSNALSAEAVGPGEGLR